MKNNDPHDPKGLIREAYRIENITLEECRSIFLDWALSVPVDANAQQSLTDLLSRYGAEDHPMTNILREGTATMTDRPKRQGRRQRQN